MQREYKLIERTVIISKGRHGSEICNGAEMDAEMDKFKKETKSKDIDYYFTDFFSNGNVEITIVNYKRLD